MKITTVGIDLAKTVFQVHGVDERGEPVIRRKLNRNKVLMFFARLEPCLVGMPIGFPKQPEGRGCHSLIVTGNSRMP